MAAAAVENRRSALFDNLLEVMDSVTATRQRRDQRHRQFSWEWQCTLGRSTNTIGLQGFSKPHNFLPGRGVSIKDPATTLKGWKRDLWFAAKDLLMEYDPDYAINDDYSVSASCLSDPDKHYVRKHIDGCDITYQLATTVGKFTGGAIKCHLPNGSTKTFRNKRKFLKFDGRLAHEVLPFKGRRYTLIFYKVYDRNMTQKAPVFGTPRIIS